MNIQNLENYVNEFLTTDTKSESAVSDASKINTERFLNEQLMKSFKLLSIPANCKGSNHGL